MYLRYFSFLFVILSITVHFVTIPSWIPRWLLALSMEFSASLQRTTFILVPVFSSSVMTLSRIHCHTRGMISHNILALSFSILNKSSGQALNSYVPQGITGNTTLTLHLPPQRVMSVVLYVKCYMKRERERKRKKLIKK